MQTCTNRTRLISWKTKLSFENVLSNKDIVYHIHFTVVHENIRTFVEMLHEYLMYLIRNISKYHQHHIWDSIIMILVVLVTNLKMYTEDARYLVQVYIYFAKYFICQYK